MFDSRRNNKFGGGGRGGNKFGGSRGFGGRDRDRDGGRPPMFKAVCSECGNPCEVPFKPTGDRPVYCNNCFKKGGNGNGDSRNFERRESRGSYEERDYGRDRDSDRQMFEATCDECGKKCEVPFRPTGGKPVFCDQCFGKGGNKGNGNNNKGNEQLMEQLAMLNVKLDRILKFLTAPATAKTVVAPKETAIVEEAPMAKKEMPAVEENAKPKRKKAAKKAKD